jgi:hypothetical protein
MPKPERFLQRSSPASIAEGKSLKMTQGNHAGQQNSAPFGHATNEFWNPKRPSVV